MDEEIEPNEDGKIPCKNCKILFKPKRKWGKHCKESCRQEFHYKERMKLIELGKTVNKNT